MLMTAAQIPSIPYAADPPPARASPDSPHQVTVVGGTGGFELLAAHLDPAEFVLRLLPFEPALERVPAAGDQLVLLASSSPQKNIGACKKLYDRRCPLPLVVYLPGPDPIDETLALEIGADEVVHGGMPPRVVASRLRALLRRAVRAAGAPAMQLRFGSLAINAATRVVRLREHTVELSSAEFDLLWLLASNAGRVMRRDDLQRQLRGFSNQESNRYVDMRFYRLQKRFAGLTDVRARLRTVRPCGYLFADQHW